MLIKTITSPKGLIRKVLKQNLLVIKNIAARETVQKQL